MAALSSERAACFRDSALFVVVSADRYTLGPIPELGGELMIAPKTSSNMRLKVGLIVFVSFTAASGPADAYLDPGSVSLVIQGIVAALAGAALTWKHWYWRLRSFLGLDRKRKPGADGSRRGPRAPEDPDNPPHGE